MLVQARSGTRHYKTSQDEQDRRTKKPTQPTLVKKPKKKKNSPKKEGIPLPTFQPSQARQTEKGTICPVSRTCYAGQIPSSRSRRVAPAQLHGAKSLPPPPPECTPLAWRLAPKRCHLKMAGGKFGNNAYAAAFDLKSLK